MISSSQRPLPDNTQQSQQTDIHSPGGIRTHNLSRRAVTDLRLRPRGHWDRPALSLTKMYICGHAPSIHHHQTPTSLTGYRTTVGLQICSLHPVTLLAPKVLVICGHVIISRLLVLPQHKQYIRFSHITPCPEGCNSLCNQNGIVFYPRRCVENIHIL